MDKDTTDISKDGITGLKSRAYFLLKLEQIIEELKLPNATTEAGVVAIYLDKASEDQLREAAKYMDQEADYATRYKAGECDIVAGAFTDTKAEEKAQLMQQMLKEKLPSMRFGTSGRKLTADSIPDQELDKTAQSAYDTMILNRSES